MAKFTEVMRQARRMCKTHEYCGSCPLWDTAESFCRIDTECYSDDSVIENIVMQWAAEHPEPVYPTWNEWYRQNFPAAYYNSKRICPMVFGDGKNCHRETDCDRCRNNMIPADIADKLGIKPKEE